MDIAFNTYGQHLVDDKKHILLFFQYFRQSAKFDHFWLSWILCFSFCCSHKAFGLLGFWQTCHAKQSSFVQKDRGSRDKRMMMHYTMMHYTCPPIEELYCETIAGAGVSKFFFQFCTTFLHLTGSTPMQLEPIVISPSFINLPITKVFTYSVPQGAIQKLKKLLRNRWRGSCSGKWSIKERAFPPPTPNMSS